MFQLTGKKAPYATGLSKPLRSRDDKGLDRPAEEQKAIELLLTTLRQATEPITIITAGSLRDVVAAFNREPELLRTKVSRLYINIGSATDMTEWNVGLDLNAYLGMMHSGLPIYFCPCMPEKPNPHTTFWKFHQGRLFEGLPRPVVNFFVYALQRVRTEDLDPKAALDADLRMWRQLPGLDERNMWCMASIMDAAGYTAQLTNGGFQPVRRLNEETDPVFKFVRAQVEIDEKGLTQSIKPDANGNMHVFTTTDNGRYQKAMTECLRQLLMNLGTSASTNKSN